MNNLLVIVVLALLIGGGLFVYFGGVPGIVVSKQITELPVECVNTLSCQNYVRTFNLPQDVELQAIGMISCQDGYCVIEG